MTSPRIYIYLDQSHLSRLSRFADEKEPAHSQLRNVLISRSDVICPFSISHINETARWPDQGRVIELYAILGLLSRGYCWRPLIDVALDEACAALAPETVVRPVGRGVEVFPSHHPAPSVADYISSHDERHWFGFLTQLATDPTLTAANEAGNQHLLRSTEFVLEARRRARPRLGEVRRNEWAMLDEQLVAIAGRLAARLNGAPAEVLEALRRRGPRVSRSLRLMVEILARHTSNVTRPTDPGDPEDWAHMGHFAHATYVLTERYYAEVSSKAAKHLRLPVKIFRKAEDLIEALER